MAAGIQLTAGSAANFAGPAIQWGRPVCEANTLQAAQPKRFPGYDEVVGYARTGNSTQTLQAATSTMPVSSLAEAGFL